MREITKADSGKELAVMVGEILELRLPENPTTGYRWQMRSAAAPVLELAGRSFAPSGDAVGAGGIQLWQFRAVSEGGARLELEQRRSWEREVIDTFEIMVQVMALRSDITASSPDQ